MRIDLAALARALVSGALVSGALVSAAVFAGAVFVRPAEAQSAGSWSYAYVSGAATATQRNSAGEVTGTISCSPPSGDLIITSYELARAGRGDKAATIQLGDFTMQARGRVDRAADGQRAFIVRLPQSPPVLAGGRRRDAVMTISVGSRSQTFASGAGQHMSDIAIACWSAT